MGERRTSPATTESPAAARRPTRLRPTRPELPRTSTLIVIAPSVRLHWQDDGLAIGVVAERLGPAFPADPRVLEPAERPVAVQRAGRVDRDRPGPDPGGDRLAVGQ